MKAQVPRQSLASPTFWGPTSWERAPLIDEAFYGRDALVVARELLGAIIVRRTSDGVVALRITETEAYRHPDDSANHCRAGRTARNAPMWGPPGRAYVYLCYGLHSLLNLVTGLEGEGAAVLVRSAEVLFGEALVHARRSVRCARRPRDITAGPGRVGSALAVGPEMSGHPVFLPGPLEVRRGPSPDRILVGPRVGIEFARPEDRAAPYRFADGSSAVVSAPATLRPLDGFTITREGDRRLSASEE